MEYSKLDPETLHLLLIREDMRGEKGQKVADPVYLVWVSLGQEKSFDEFFVLWMKSEREFS